MSISPGFGVVLRDLPGSPVGDELLGAIASANSRGASVLQVPLAALPHSDEIKSRREVRASLSRNDVQLTVSLGAVNAVFPDRNPALAGDLVAGLTRALESARALGVSVAHTTVGTLDDRFGESGGPDWQEQLRVNGELLGRAADLAASAGVTLVLKTHEEMSTTEVADLVTTINSPALRVGFSPVNVLTRLENPVAAFERVSSFVHTVFVDDSVLERTPQGLRRHMVEVGMGIVDWVSIRSAAATAPQPISMVIDLHRAEFEMPLYGPGWLAREPHATVSELASLFEGSRPAAPALPSAGARFDAAQEFAST